MTKKISPREFPRSEEEPFDITSPQDKSYNCIAWAAQIDNRFCWPGHHPSEFWPPTLKKEETIDALMAFYELYGYVVCADDKFEEGFDKIALFEKDGKPTHAARQLGPDLWSSKLGREWDVSHTLAAMQDGYYGNPTVFMKRKKSPNEAKE